MNTFRYLLFPLSLLIVFKGYSQNLKLDWVRSIDGGFLEESNAMAIDVNGNIVTAGHFNSGTVDFDPGSGVLNLSTNGGADAYVQKLDNNGDLVWARTIGGSGEDRANDIVTDQAGNFYITGTFSSTVDFDPGAGTLNIPSMGLDDCFILKLDANGDFVWARSIGGTSYDFGLGIAYDPSGSIYITGRYDSSPVDFDPGAGTFNISSNGQSESYLLKLDTNGNFLWANSLGGQFNDYSYAVTVDSFGNVYTTGYFEDTVDFDPGAGISNLISFGDEDIYVRKLSSNGNLLWARAMGGGGRDQGVSVHVDNAGNVYSTGYFEGTVDFDPSSGVFNLFAASLRDVFIHKLDSAGDFEWAGAIRGTSIEEGLSVTTDDTGNIYVTGYYVGAPDFDPGAGFFFEPAVGGGDIFIEKLDSSGSFLWVQTFGGALADRGHDVIVDNSGAIFLTGSFSDTVDFDPQKGGTNLFSNGSTAAFIQKISGCSPEFYTDVQRACSTYTWINGITYTENNDTAMYLVPGGAENGCDSIMVLDLIIDRLNRGVTQQYNALTADETDAKYRWLRCDSNFAPMPGDTSRGFIANENGVYAVEITKNTCKDTSACIAIMGIGFSENSSFGDISVFPNPTTGSVTIDLKSLKNVDIEITNTSGQIVHQDKGIQTANFQFELPYSPGLYYVKLHSGGEQRFFKLVRR